MNMDVGGEMSGRRFLFLLCFCWVCVCIWGSSSWALGVSKSVVRNVELRETESSVLGGSLLNMGEVAMTFGVGFPDVLFRFDFANSKLLNLATQLKFNYNFGLPFFGANVFWTFPTRIGIVQDTKLNFALLLEPGIFVGGGYLEKVFFGFPLNVGALFSLHLSPKWVLNFGMEFPMTFSIEPTDKVNVLGFNLPIELTAGAEFKLNKEVTLFAKLAGGPYVFVGNIAELNSKDALGQRTSDVLVTGSLRLLLGMIYRR